MLISITRDNKTLDRQGRKLYTRKLENSEDVSYRQKMPKRPYNSWIPKSRNKKKLIQRQRRLPIEL
jgi:hypothetical protein